MSVETMKTIKIKLLLLLATNLGTTTQVVADNFSQTHMAKLDKLEKVDYDDLAHENKGCPENSICSPETAKKFIHWNNFLVKLSPLSRKQQVKKLNQYLSQSGLPVSFLAKEDDGKNIQGAFWSSRCRHHNLKDQTKIYKGLAFLKSSNTPSSMQLDDATVIETGVKYKLPYQHSPIMNWNDKLVYTLDFDSLFFHIGVDSKGLWEVLNIPSKEINLAIDHIQRVPCNKKIKANIWHTELICKKIWNNKIKATQTLQMSWSCP